MKNLLFFFIFGIFNIYVSELYAQDQQKIDSIKIVNSVEKNQKILVDNSNEIAYLYGSIDIDSSLFYSNKAKQIAKKIAYRKGLAVAHSYTARGMIDRGKFNVAIENFNTALELFIVEKDSVNILDCYSGLGYVASYASSQLKCLDYNLKALSYAEKLKDTASLSSIYNNIGSIYMRLDNYKSSLLYFKKSLDVELSKSNSKEGDLAISYSNIGILKIDHNKYKEAEEDYENVKKLLPKIRSNYLTAYLFLSLSSYYNETRDFKMAKSYIDSAATISEEHDFKQIKPRLYKKRAEWYFNQNLFTESIQYFNKCLAYSKSINVYEEFPEIYKKRAQAYSKLGLYKEAFYSLQKANVSIDSLKNSSVASFLSDFEDQKRINEIEKLKFEQALKDQQLENEFARKKELKYKALIVVLSLLFILGLLIYFFIKVNKKNKILKQQHETIHSQKLLLENNIKKLELKEEKLQELNATKDKFFSIIAHDLKSPFNAILGFSQLLVENYNLYNNTKRLEMISQIEKSSESTLNLLENLLHWARSQRDLIELKIERLHLKRLIDTSISAYLGAASIKTINIKNTIDEELICCVDSSTMKIVFSNLFSNAIKFSEIGGEISLTAKTKKNSVEVCFQDFGIGMNAATVESLFKVDKNVKRGGTSKEKGTGLGLILCKEFVDKNSGKIWVESEEGVGSKFYVSLPITCD